MRTTLTLDPDVVQALHDQVHRRRRSFKEVVNDAIRRGLATAGGGAARGRPYRVRSHRSELRPGIDPVSLGRLADEMENEAILAKIARRR
jgi:hypothetical protein